MKYYLNGDINQMLVQQKHLETQCSGFKLGVEYGIHPYLESKQEYDRAVSCIWLDKVEGWWNYKEDLIRNEHCTEEEFFETLKG